MKSEEIWKGMKSYNEWDFSDNFEISTKGQVRDKNTGELLQLLYTGNFYNESPYVVVYQYVNIEGFSEPIKYYKIVKVIGSMVSTFIGEPTEKEKKNRMTYIANSGENPFELDIDNLYYTQLTKSESYGKIRKAKLMMWEAERSLCDTKEEKANIDEKYKDILGLVEIHKELAKSSKTGWSDWNELDKKQRKEYGNLLTPFQKSV